MGLQDVDELISKLVEAAVKDVVGRVGSTGTGVLDISSEEEFNRLLSSNKYVVVCFYKSECPACKSYIPTFESVSKDFKDVALFVKINTKNLKSVSKKYNVIAIPTTVVFVDGSEVSRYEGSMNSMKLTTFLIASGLKRISGSKGV
ncbi:MAG: thioredoxin family protein [Sulfolobales archaeon]